ncbi:MULTISPECIES: GntR family transcriptional regulator [Actinokineospora]|uniref:GntR family transcriptional regulator n=1 Tax=Actinokineospora fastidiosa TaxID=1816 RepID=A0A918LJE3_9PSEU|nr:MULTISPECIES: GntR family transcriptional regulator [Actinokineospora]UVS78973.1 HTH-type transcriptional repressor DasR [Actinokineospora sp. UTMC 2448]GGS55620.1 GntR family transcriptional regulator [Actinokineospora fastidiosa]
MADNLAENGRKSARTPKHWALKDRLLAMVAAAGPGGPLPGERALAEGFGVSRTTVRKALTELMAEGRLTRVHGSGTYVGSGKVTQRLQLSSYTEDMRSHGLNPTSSLLEAAIEAAEPELAALLAVPAGADVLRLRRLRSADGEPMAIETSRLPLTRFPGLEARVGDTSLYRVLWEHYGVELGHAEETIETTLATPADAALLGNEVGAVMLRLSRHSFDTDNRPVEWVRSVYRGDRYKFVATLVSPREVE